MTRFFPTVALLATTTLLGALLGALPGASAATVRAHVVDGTGTPFPMMKTELIDLVAGTVVARVQTGRDGIAIFESLLHGQYRVSISRYDRTVVHPDDNPLVHPADFSVVDQFATLDVQVVVHRGVPLHLRFVVDGSVVKNVARVYFEELESGKKLERRLAEEERVFKLFTGRWQVRVEAPDGLLLNKIDVDGRAETGAAVTLDLRAGDRSTVIAWEYVAPARLTGRVLFEREKFAVRVAAELLEPGGWVEAARQRGMQHDRVVVGIDPTGGYVLELPDGRWRVHPVGPHLAKSEPAEEIVELRPGDELRASFVVRESEKDSDPLLVEVQNIGGEGVEDAVVELWPLDEAERGDAPLRSARSENYGMTILEDVPAGDYLLAAAHVDHPEGITELPGYIPGDDETTRVVTLNQGGRIEITLVDPDGLATGDTWVVARARDAAPYYVKDPAIANAAKLPRTLVDQTDRAVLRGLYPGTYEVAALTPTAFIRLRDGEGGDDGDWIEKLELHLHANEVRKLEARVVPAGLLTGRVYCRNGAAIPGRLDLRVVPNRLQPESPLDERWKEAGGAALSLDEVPLTGALGSARDRFDAGPLAASSYIVALRPVGFDRWTWAFGSENGADAGSFELAEGQQVDLGAIGVDCGPAIRLALDVASGAPAPDLRDLRMQSDHLEISGSVRTVDDETVELRDVAIETHERLVWVRGLAEGEADLHVRLGHRYFLPRFWIDVPIDATLGRGATHDVTVGVADVGGAIAIHALGAAAARLVRDETTVAQAAFDGERVTLPNIPAGSYRVELCADATCDTVQHVWPDVAVELLVTTRLAFGFPPAD